MDNTVWNVALGVFLGGGALTIAWSIFTAAFPGLTGAGESARVSRELLRHTNRIADAAEEIRQLLQSGESGD